MADVKAVEFEAEIRQVKTMVDRSVNIVLNIPETCQGQAIEFLRHVNELVKVVAEFA